MHSRLSVLRRCDCSLNTWASPQSACIRCLTPRFRHNYLVAPTYAVPPPLHDHREREGSLSQACLLRPPDIAMTTQGSSANGSQPLTDDYFNDISQQPAPPADMADRNAIQTAKAKRIACVLCRKRKLRCDGVKPSCGTCKRLSHDCSYDEVRRKSGPKRGYVKALEARLGTSARRYN